MITRLLAYLLLVVPSLAFAQGFPFSYLSAANNTCVVVHPQPSIYLHGLFINTTATLYYLKLYDRNTAGSAGTGTPFRRIPVAASATGAVVDDDPGTAGIVLRSGLTFCLTSGIADSDTGNAATGVALNFVLK